MLWPAVVVATHILALGLLAWAVRGRVPRSGVRCPRCWYDMAAAAPSPDGSLRCPECGRAAADSEWARPGEAWRYSKKRWRVVGAAVLIEVGCSYYWFQRTPGYESWTGVMPDWVLMELVTTFPDDNLVSRSLGARWEKGELSRRHIAELCERFLAQPQHTGYAAPHTRARWPVGIPIIIGQTRGYGHWRVAGLDGEEFWAEGEVPPYWGYPQRDLWDVKLPRVIADWGTVAQGQPAHAGVNRNSVTVEQGVYWHSQDVWSQRVETSVEYQGVEGIEQCMTPVDHAEARQRIVSGLAIGISRPMNGDAIDLPAVLHFNFYPEWMGLGAYPDYTIAVRITIEHEGFVLAEYRENEAELAVPLSEFEVFQRSIFGDAAWDRVRRDGGHHLNLEGVVVRIRPDPEGALADLARDKYWSGEIVLDGSELIKMDAPRWLPE